MKKHFTGFLSGLVVGLLFFIIFGLFRGGIPGGRAVANLFPNNLAGLFLIGLPYAIVAAVLFAILLFIKKSPGKIVTRSLFFGLGVYVSYLPVVWMFLLALSNFQIL